MKYSRYILLFVVLIITFIIVYYKIDIDNKKVFVTYYYSNNLDSVHYIDTLYFTKSTENNKNNIFYHKKLHFNNEFHFMITNINNAIYFQTNILHLINKMSYNNYDIFIYYYDIEKMMDEEGLIILNNKDEMLLFEGTAWNTRIRFDYNNYPKYVADSIISNIEKIQQLRRN
jgi:hypothetical protein